MYVIHLIVLLNILGVMIDNKRFVFATRLVMLRTRRQSRSLGTVATPVR